VESQVDKEALRETLDLVLDKAAEGTWRQSTWFEVSHECDTVACFCGWRALQDGAQIVKDSTLCIIPFMRVPDPWYTNGQRTLYSTNSDDWVKWGADRFGLSNAQATVLFDPHNELEELKEIVDILCGENPEEAVFYINNIRQRAQDARGAVENYEA
jgi:hypothetical protein